MFCFLFLNKQLFLSNILFLEKLSIYLFIIEVYFEHFLKDGIIFILNYFISVNTLETGIVNRHSLGDLKLIMSFLILI